MILFWSIALALSALALLFVLPPMLRRRAQAADPRAASNAELYREQMAELQAELERGAIGRDEFERAGREIERRIVAEHAAASTAAGPAEPPRATAVAIGFLVPIVAVLCYIAIGQPKALAPGATGSQQELAALAERLAAHLEKQPGDAASWAQLGHALASTGQYGRGAQALARSLQIDPGQHEVLVDFVDTLAQAGRAEFEAGNHAAAIEYWERILPFAPKDSEFARAVQAGIAEARQAIGSPATGAGAPAASGGASVQGVVRLDAALKAQASPQDTVFIAARSPSGSRVPLAVTRTTVDKLPYRFTLDDSMAMAPGMNLSSQPKVIIVARISKSGVPTPQAGDIEGVSVPVATGATGVEIVLSKIVP